jgi:hypothetical protein
MAQIRESSEADDAASLLSLALMGWFQQIRIEDLFVTCLSCKHLGEKGGQCNKFPGYPIPAHVVIQGCEAYEDHRPRKAPTRFNGSHQNTRYIEDDDIPF